MTSLGDLVEADSGVTYGVVKPGEFVQDGVPMVRGSDIGYHTIRVENLPRISHDLAGQYERTRLRGGELLVSLVGNPGAVSEVARELVGSNVSRAVAVVKLRSEINRRFVLYYLRSPTGRAALQGRSQGSVQSVLNLRDLRDIDVPMPSEAEQAAVASTLGRLDDKIDVNRRIVETLEQIAKTLFKSWFVDFDPVRGDRHSPDDIRALFPEQLVDSLVGPVPEGWRVSDVSALASTSRKLLDPHGHPDEEFDYYSLPAFDASKMPSAEPGSTIKSTKLSVEPGSVLISKLNPSIPRVWWPQPPTFRRAIASTEFVVALPRPTATRAYLYGLFTSAKFLTSLASLVRGTSGSHQRVSVGDLLGIRVVVPPDEVVARFDAVAAPMFKQQEALATQSRTLADLRDTLLPRLISGALRLPDSQVI